jgi:xanthine/CO dehydrogenase XdhC/CoxF family maturation factor
MNHVNATSAAAARPRAAGSKRMSPPVLTSRDPTSDLSGGQLEWAPAGQDWQDVALQMRLLLGRGISLAIATIVDARGAGVRQPGTVLVVTEAGESIGYNPDGPLDQAIRDLAAEALATGQNRLKHLRIDKVAAAYIGLSGEISLEVHVMHVRGGDPTFASVLRYLDSGAAAVLIIGTRSAAVCAVVGADRVAGQLGRPALPIPVIDDARRMLGCRRTISRTYRLSGEKSGTGIRVWMMSYPRA